MRFKKVAGNYELPNDLTDEMKRSRKKRIIRGILHEQYDKEKKE